MTTVPAPVPAGFWQQIDHQLDRIKRDKPSTFDEIRAILLDPSYVDITAEINRNFVRHFGPDAAFFAGSGGDRTLFSTLYAAGWQPLEHEAAYYYAVQHPTTHEIITYTEGDVERGDLSVHA